MTKFTTKKGETDFNLIEIEKERMKLEKRLAVVEEATRKLDYFLQKRLTPGDYVQFLKMQQEYIIKLQMLS